MEALGCPSLFVSIVLAFWGSNPTPRTLVQRLRLAHTHQNRRRTAIQIRIQSILRSTWHSTQALLSMQSRKQWAGRSCSEKSQGHRITLYGKRGKYTTCYSCLAQYKPPRLKLSRAAILRTKTAARPALTTAASGSCCISTLDQLRSCRTCTSCSLPLLMLAF